MEKIYQKNSNECVLVDVLSRLDERTIRTMDDLMAPENTDLYEELWLAMKNFVNCVVLKSKTRKLKNGQSGKGNAERVRELQEMGVELEDIRRDVLLKVMEQIDKALCRTEADRVSYCTTVANNEVTNIYRRYFPAGKMWSLQYPLSKRNKDGKEKEFTLEDCLADRMNAEDWAVSNETIREFAEKRRRDLRNDLQQLKTADQAFVYLCMYDRMRPRHIYAAVKAYAAGRLPREAAALMYEQLCRKYDLCSADLPAAGSFSCGMTRNLSTLDQKRITNKISDVKLTMPEGVKAHLNARLKEEPAASLRK